MQACRTCKKLANTFQARLISALPTIVFYIIQFLVVFFVFGSQFAMVVTGSTTLFQLRHKQRNDTRAYITLFFVPLVLCLLAFLATRNVVLCILLNFGVLFFLVIWKSSQFEPKGHLGFAMTFVFLELRPPEPEELWLQLSAVAFCQVLLLLALALCARRYRPADPSLQIPAGLHRLSELMEQMACEGSSEAVDQELYDTAQKLHHLGYARRRLLRTPDPQRNRYHFLALLYQRTAYLVADKSWKDSATPTVFSQTLHSLAQAVDACERAHTAEERAALLAQLTGQLEHPDLPQGRLRIFYRNVLHIVCLFCQEPTVSSADFPWKRIPWRAVLLDFRQRCSVDRFEFRFALQLGLVMTISSTVSYLWNFEHTYWFPLHAFLLLQPSYEDSAHRMVTRPIGTAIGCVLVHLAYPHLPGMAGVFLFSLVMISIMYCCTPGTWVQPIFSTSFALTMATLTLEESEAIQLRLLYLAMAVVLVLIVNHFFLPNRKEQQFKSNLRELTRLQGVYWHLIRRSLREPFDSAVFCELLSQFHMVHHAAHLYAQQLPEAEAQRYHRLLLTFWSMFSQLEQVGCLIQSELIQEADYGPLDELAGRIARSISPLQPSITDIDPSEVHQPDLRHFLERYLANGRTLLTFAPLLSV